MVAVYRRLELAVLSFFIIVLITLNSLVKRVRMSHENGVAARGRIKIVTDPDIPATDDDFFRSGAEFSCRLRHASVSYMDDARLVARSASLKFSDQDYDSPLDLMMNSGELGPFHDAWTFFRFMLATMRGRDPYIIPYLKEYKMDERGIEMALRYPDSFTDLYYHSKVPLAFNASDGKPRYVRFRLIPGDRRPDGGFATKEEMECYWKQLPRPGETRSRNYLKEDYERRVAENPVEYILQIQLHEVAEGESRDYLSAVQPWSEPWVDLAHVSVSEMIDYEAGNRMWFDIANHPGCMGIVKPRSIHDPASLNHLRKLGIWARRARLFAYRLFSMPKPIPGLRDAESPEVGPYELRLPQDETERTRLQRRYYLERQLAYYEFSTQNDQPAFVKNLPEKEQFSKIRDRRMLRDALISYADLLFVAFKWLRRPKGKLSDYDIFYLFREEPAVRDCFDSDLEFGRQRLAGLNPLYIRRCDDIPEQFDVVEETVAGLLDPEVTLDSAIGAGRMFLLDYKVLEGITVKNGYLTQPFCLLYADNQGRLRPVAIQLFQEKGPDAPVFTPRDPFWLWLTAKTFVQSADAAYHEVVAHLLHTHLVSETFAVATARRLHPRHPLHELMKPFFRFTMAINHGARTSMLAPGGAIDKTLAAGYEGSIQLLASEFRKWTFDDLDLPQNLKDRGVDDPDILPDYPYRDDGLKMWAAFEEFVGNYVDLFYPTDEDVRDDEELARWAGDLADPACGNVRGFEARIDGVAELKKILVRILYTASAGHAAVNNGQYDMYGYAANVPGSLYSPPPRSKCQLTEKDFVDALPSFRKFAAQLVMIHLLSIDGRLPLGGFHDARFADLPQVWPVIRDFRDRLDQISSEIEERNKGLAVPYTYLDPRSVSESVNI